MGYKVNESETAKKVVMEEIKNSIVQSKEAIQKVAIINLYNHYDWGVLANDKKTGNNPKVAEYFEAFLEMRMKDTHKALTIKAIDLPRKWAPGATEIGSVGSAVWERLARPLDLAR